MSFLVRKATPQDADELLRLWQERKDVYLKLAPRTQPMSADEWRGAVLSWLDRPDAAVMVADREGQLIGYMVGWMRENLPMHLPAHYGLVSEMSVDGHCKQGGVGTAMLAGLKDWFKANHLDYIEVRVPRLQPIEQAFWRSVGAADMFDHLWYRLD